MTKEAEDQIRTVSQTSKTAIGNRKQFIFIYWGGILDLLFDVAMTQFFWVDFWRIRGQPFHHNLRMLSEENVTFLLLWMGARSYTKIQRLGICRPPWLSAWI